jgi:hypothetical protein
VLRELYEALERLDASQTRGRGRPAADPVIDLRDVVRGGSRPAATRPVRPAADWVLDDPRW